jgi:hypothetical protein
MGTTPKSSSRLPGAEGEVDFDLRQMQGSYELGEHRRALTLARRILSRPKLGAEAFGGSVSVICACAVSCRRWIPPVEEAWKRLSLRDRRRARTEMLGFRYSSATLDQALPLATARPCSSADFMFSLATFTHHRREKEAQRLITVGKRCLKFETNPFVRACILRAITHHHLERREWANAFNAANQIPSHGTFIGEQYLDMAVAVRGATEDALKVLENLSDDETEVSHPGLDKVLRSDWRQKLLRLCRSLAWTCRKPTAERRS